MVRLWTLLLLLLLFGPVLATAQQEPAELFIESSIQPPDPYVQQAVTYEIRLYRRSSLLQGDLLLLEVPGVVVEPLGEEEPRWIERDGSEYQLVRSRYLLFPQRSGILSLPGAVYSGWEAYARGGALELRVRPSPPGVEGAAWLPARSLRLEERWDPGLEQWHQGRPVERRVVLEARGLTAAQLPPPSIAELPGVRIQAQSTRFEDRIEEAVPIGRREDLLLYLPQRPGALELPPLRLEWWSTESDRLQTATLPARRVEIDATGPLTQPDDVEARPAGTSGRTPLPAAVEPLLWALVPVAAVALILLYRPLRRLLQQRLLLLGFAAACRRNHAPDAWERLSAWSRLIWDTAPGAPGVLAGRLADERAEAALWSLDAALYGGVATAWDGRTAACTITPALKRQRTARPHRPSVLPGLDP